jgi:hypothetical protein
MDMTGGREQHSEAAIHASRASIRNVIAWGMWTYHLDQEVFGKVGVGVISH